MHLPVAPACNIQCNYCHRDFDCVNESRPGVTSGVLTPKEALDRFLKVKQKMPNLTVIGFAGPGDALANFDNVKETTELIKNIDPGIIFCLSTNGLRLPDFAQDIINIGITHVTITINAIDKEIAKQIYSGVEPEELINNQLTGLKYLTDRGIIVKVNIVAIKGINDLHIEDIAKKVKRLGAFKTNIMQLVPAKGARFEGVEKLKKKELNEIRKKCSQYINQMYHCQRCRADAIGLLNQDRSILFRNTGDFVFAIASESGEIIDQHFGKAKRFLIYKYSDGEIKQIDKRPINQYCTGIDECNDRSEKFNNILNALKGCDGVISLRIGNEPKKKLQENNIKSFEIYNTLEGAIKKAIQLLEEKK